MEHNKEEVLQEHIRLFAMKNLPKAEQEELFRQIQQDPALGDEVVFSVGLAQALKDPELVAASALIAQTLRVEGPPPSAAPSYLRLFKWIIGAAVAIFLTGGIYWGSVQGVFDSREERVARDFLKPLENVMYAPKSQSHLQALNAGLDAYEQAKYVEAAGILERYLKQSPDNTVRLYFGSACVLAKQPDRALSALATAANSQEAPVREAALWYLSLAYLQKKDRQQALETLQRVEEPLFYSESIRELKERLKD